MASRPQKSAVIDGFTSVRAATRARTSTKLAHQTEPGDGAARSLDESAQDSTRFKRTAKPKRFDIRCYHCGYEFPLYGRLRTTSCPKCREELSAEKVVIDSERTVDIRSIARVELAATGRLLDCSVTAHHFVMAGDARVARRIECDTLTIMHRARYEMRHITARDIIIDEGALTRFRRQVSCRDIVVHGQLDGDVVVQRAALIVPGALFTGKLQTHSLTIEDGGSLIAELNLCPGKRGRS